MLMNDGSSKTLMVDERQTVREVLDNLFEKTHCDCNVDWSLCETNHELQLGEFLKYHHQVMSQRYHGLCKDTRDESGKNKPNSCDKAFKISNELVNWYAPSKNKW